MVVQPVVDVLVLMGLQSGGDVHPPGLGGGLGLGQDVPLAGVGSAGGEPVRPHRHLAGDEGEVHRHIHIFHQGIHIIQITGHLGGVGPVEPGDEGILAAKVDPVVLPLACQALGHGLGGDPLIPEDELVGEVGLEIGHKLAGKEVAALPGEWGQAQLEVIGIQLGLLGQVAVFVLGEVPVGADEVGGEEDGQEAAEQCGEEDGVAF